jgi:hypothetical protein
MLLRIRLVDDEEAAAATNGRARSAILLTLEVEAWTLNSAAA